jgi:hypothetical protein
MGFRSWVRERFVTPDAVYGSILYSALIGAVSDDDSSAVEVVIVSGISLIVFWAAHVFAGTVAGHGVKDGVVTPLGASFRRSIAHSSGMLYAAILPTLALLLGVFHVTSVDDAVSIALFTATVILGVLGFQSFAQRGSPIAIRILGGLGTALFGAIMIALNIAVH